MLRALAGEDVPWKSVHVMQVDERVAPRRRPGPQPHAPAREPSLARAAAPGTDPCDARRSPGPRGGGGRLRPHARAGRGVAARPRPGRISGWDPTATRPRSCPGDPVLSVTDRDVALTGAYMGRRRMTLTFPVLDRARRVLWLVTGSDKAPMFPRLTQGDPSIPAGRVRSDAALVLADRAARRGRARLPGRAAASAAAPWGRRPEKRRRRWRARTRP